MPFKGHSSTSQQPLKPGMGDEACLSAQLRESPRPVNRDVTCPQMVVCTLQDLIASTMKWTLFFFDKPVPTRLGVNLVQNVMSSSCRLS